MYISLNWIRDFTDIPSQLNAADIAQRLTLSTVEIEGVKDFHAILDRIVVGKVVKKEKHPDADKLSVCLVYDGEKEYQVVCGASNVYEGMLCAYAKPGAKVKWHGQGNLITLQKAKIRGVESHGMICAAVEIGLTDKFKEEDGILDISSLQEMPGTPLANALQLDDIVLEVDNKSMTHRPDLWGHYGMARECSAVFKTSLSSYEVEAPSCVEDSSYAVHIDIENTQSCVRYSGVIIKNVKVMESPQWIKARLIAGGMRPINNIVDITNYIMLELGQPLHAFDVEQISKDKQVHIVVRHAKEKEILTTLDGNTLELDPAQLVIANQNGEVIGLAGIKGGLHSGIHEQTTDIFIESAHFDPVIIRKGSAKASLRTEASARFEKFLDPNLVPLALKKAIQMITQQIPDAVCVNEIVDNNHWNPKPITLNISVKDLHARIGMPIAKQEMMDILKRLGFLVKEEKDLLSVHVPSWRATKDILHAYDLVEEITRVYGYDHITPIMPQGILTLPKKNDLRLTERTIKDVLVHLGLTETYNYSFISEDDTIKIDEQDKAYIQMDNPYASNITHFRRNLLSGLLKNISVNRAKYKEMGLFEMGKTCLAEIDSSDCIDTTKPNVLPLQPFLLTCVMTKKDALQEVFYELKHIVEQVLSALKIPYMFKMASDIMTYEQKNATALMISEGQEIGRIGQIRQSVAHAYDIDETVYYATFDMNELAHMRGKSDIFTPLSKYPSVKLDMAIILDEKILWQDIKEIVQNTGGDVISHMDVFDVYTGKPIEEGKKSLAFHIEYQSKEKTMTIEEAQHIHKKILIALEQAFQAELRM